ncbi:MAG: E3 binding domain-containing protein, partial [Actinomycetota bacterium]|nr:E3 binding domain-containing protein [Actinomycetota bacterium]
MSSSSTSATGLVDVTMPQMGVSVSEGTIAEWHKAVGDEVAYEEAIVSISTDKIDTELPSPVAGVVQEILVEVGQTVEVGVVLARIASGGPSGPTDGEVSQTNAEIGASSEAAAAVGETPAPSSDSPAPVEEAPKQRGYSPVVMRIAAEHGIDLTKVEGTGRGGRVTKKDVLAFVENGGGSQGDPP